MPFQFSRIEQAKIYTSWLAWKDIRTQEFLKTFRPLWNLAIKEVEVLLERCHCKCRLKEVGKVGLTIQPSVSFAFSPIKKGFFINVWLFFFCLMRDEVSIFFRPSFLLANELLHEYAHYKFWRDNGMLDVGKESKKKFESEHGLENEKNALAQEVKFLRRVRRVVPGRERIKIFRVQSWTNAGMPICEGRLAQLENRKNINFMIKLTERAIQDLSSKRSYDNRMTKQATENHATLSSILKLNTAREDYPIVEMKV